MPTEHKVKQGECLSSIAERYGIFPDTIENDPGNAKLKAERDDLNVLFPGDVLVIPDKRLKEINAADGQTHRFRKKGTPARLRLRLLDDDDSPRANLKFQLLLDGIFYEGTTDGEGKIDQAIPPKARKGVLMLEDDDPIELSFGRIDPIDTPGGVQARLHNLGFDCGAEKDAPGEKTRAALAAFQKQNGLPETGEADQATRDKLRQVHGS